MILYSDEFKKVFKKRISKNPILVRHFAEKVKVLESNPHQPQLKTHKLIGGLKDYWAFSLTYEYRVVFQIKDDDIILIDVGTHDQVY